MLDVAIALVLACLGPRYPDLGVYDICAQAESLGEEAYGSEDVFLACQEVLYGNER